MKLSKAFITEIVAQLVAIATVIVQQRLSPDDLELAITVIAAVEIIAAIVAGQFAMHEQVASIKREVKLFVQGK